MPVFYCSPAKGELVVTKSICTERTEKDAYQRRMKGLEDGEFIVDAAEVIIV